MKRVQYFLKTDGIPRIQEALLALQHAVAMIVGCVTLPLLWQAQAGLENKDQVILIQVALVVAALSTLLQLFFPLGRSTGLVSDFPSLWGVSFAYVPSMQAIADGYGIDTILGAQIVGGVVAVIMGIW